MIKINLLGDTSAVDRAAARWLGGYAASAAAALVVCFLAFSLAGRDLERLTGETTALAGELQQLKETTKDVRGLDAKKTELRAKLEVIEQLKLSKSGPVRVLDDLNTAVPDRAWLTEIGENAGVLRVTGFALDNQTIAAFMKNLETSDFFQAVELVETKRSERDGVAIKTFTLETRVIYTGKSFRPSTSTGAPSAEEAQ